MNFFKKLFGLQDQEDNNGFQQYFEERSNEPTDFNRFQTFDEEPRRGFDVFTDPLQMHQYFEQQMNEMLRNFGFEGFGNMFGMPSIEGGSFHDSETQTPQMENPENLRDHFLKKGYEKPTLPSQRQDKDVDGKLNFGDIESVLKGKPPQTEIVPFQENRREPTSFSFGQSMTSKTIRNADGSMEIHKTVRDNAGNEETTITRKFGDREYTMIKKKDKNGKEEVIENFINIDESEKDKFLVPQNLPKLNDKPNSSFPFDKFFK